MCRSEHPSFYDPECDIRESERIILRRDIEEELADTLNDEKRISKNYAN